ncbi:MAG: DUF1460 domain-containing protein [Betaproteobacteria bacterium]|nr:DUF1460 domain-containing protein [Betaproteobacteria bacterium]
MRIFAVPVVAAITLLLFAGCTTTPPAPRPYVSPTKAQIEVAQSVGINATELDLLLNKPLYEMKPEEVHRYLGWLAKSEPDLRKRVAHLARQNINQPYELYLLGEFPYEVTDDQPLFDLTKSDCVVYVEHTYAMALSASWEEFFWVLQRIRYKDGVIGVVTRNHYTETDWNPNNAWLVTDITQALGGVRTQTYPLKVDRKRFLKNRYKLDREIPIEDVKETYVPKEMVAEVESQLKDGDFVNIISGKGGGKWASHVGMVVIDQSAGSNGKRMFIHSQEPMVREETFQRFVERANEREARVAATGVEPQRLHGFKFFRLNENPDVPPMKAQPRPGRH